MANLEQTSYVVHASIAYLLLYKYLLGPHGKTAYVSKIYVTKNSCYHILNYKEKLLNNFSKILEKHL